VPPARLQAHRRPTRPLQFGNRLAQLENRQAVRRHIAQRELIGPYRIADEQFGHPVFGSGADIEPRHIGKQPPRSGEPCQIPMHQAVQFICRSIVDRDILQLNLVASTDHGSRVDQIIAILDPDIGAYVARCGNRPEIHFFPLGQSRAGRGDHGFVEHKGQQCHTHAGDDQRSKNLVRGKTACLHRDDFAVLVQRRQRDYRSEQDGKGQETGYELRCPQRDIGPEFGFSIARMGQNLAALAQQIERLQYQDQ